MTSEGDNNIGVKAKKFHTDIFIFYCFMVYFIFLKLQ